MTHPADENRSAEDRPAETRTERPELLIVCGCLALLGMIVPIILILVATSLVEHDFVSDTISDLARGPKKWIMDGGFYANAAGLLALAIGSAHHHLGRVTWSIGIFTLALIALVTVLLGLWDQFHTVSNNPPGMTVHTKLTFFLGPLYLAGPLLMAYGAAQRDRVFAILFIASAVLWTILALAFKLAPNGYDGILEKAAVLATMLWTGPLAWILLTRGYREMH